MLADISSNYFWKAPVFIVKIAAVFVNYILLAECGIYSRIFVDVHADQT
jgi:hypothetical protein